MNIVLVSEKTSTFVTSRLIEEAKKRSHNITHLFYSDLVISLGDKIEIKFRQGSLPENFDAVILRMAEGKSMVSYKDILTKEFAKKAFVLNSETFIKYPHFGKIMQNYQLAAHSLPVVPTQLFASADLVHSFDYPLILKQDMSRLGLGVKKIENQQELEKVFEEGSSQWLEQKFLSTGQDYRVFVVGGEVLPKVMRKTAPEGKFITNFAQGGSIEAAELTDQLRDLALKAAKVFDCDYCGIDIMYDENGNPHVLEVNRSANFQGFEMATGINVAQKTIEYLEKKVNNDK